MARTLELLDRLIAFDTTSRNSNLELAGFARDVLKRHGFRVTEIPNSDGQKVGLYAETGPETGGGVMLSAHTDVVPVTGQRWTRDPFRLTVEGDRLFGRGTTDMKGYVAAMLALGERTAGAELREPLKFVLSYDEEVGCVGIQEMLDRLAPLIGKPRACFVGEPTEMQVAVGHKGKAALRATCFGQSGHSALAPNFINALHLAADFVTALRELQRHYAEHGHRDSAYSVPYTTVHAGLLGGGTALNIVPDQAEITFEYRHLATESPADIQNRIYDAANRVCDTYRPLWEGARIEIDLYNAYPGLDVPETDKVVALAQRLAQTNDTTKVAFGTEAGFFSALGIPTVVCGPGSMEGQGHKPDEYISIRELTACDMMMDRILAELCF